MDNLLGLLRVRVRKGINLAVRDTISSDPYVVLTMGQQVSHFALHYYYFHNHNLFLFWLMIIYDNDFVLFFFWVASV